MFRLNARGSAWAVALAWAAILGQFAAAAWVSYPWITGDTPHYLELARALDVGRYGLELAGRFQPDTIRPPVYPMLLWLLHVRLGLPLVTMVVLQLGCLALSVWLLQRLLTRLELPVLPFLLLVAAYPFPAMYAATIMTEGPTTLLMTAVAVLLAFPERLDVPRLMLLGLLAGLAAMLRSTFVLLPFAIVLVAVVAKQLRSSGIRQSLSAALVPLVVATLVMAPYAVWNRATFGKLTPVPVITVVPHSMYVATWPDMVSADIDSFFKGEPTVAARRSGLADEVVKLNQQIGAPVTTPPWSPVHYARYDGAQQRSMEVMSRAARQRIAEDPARYGHYVARNVWRLWNTTEYPETLPKIITVYLKLISAAVFILGLLGVTLALWRPAGWKVPAWPVVLLAYLPAIHIWLHTEARYTAPARYLLLLYGSAAFLWLIGRLKTRVSAKSHDASVPAGAPAG